MSSGASLPGPQATAGRSAWELSTTPPSDLTPPPPPQLGTPELCPNSCPDPRPLTSPDSTQQPHGPEALGRKPGGGACLGLARGCE